MDGRFQLVHALKDAAAELFSGELGEEAFDNVEPGAAGRRKVRMESWVLLHPGLHLFVFMRGVVVHDQMDIQVRWRFPVYKLEELDPFLMTVLVHAGRNDPSFGHLDGREQRRRSVALVVVRHRAATAFLYGQFGLRPIEGLNRCLLVCANHQSVLGRVQVQTDHIMHLLFEVGIVANFELLDQVRLESVGAQHSKKRGSGLYRSLRQAPVLSTEWRPWVSLLEPS